MMDPASRAKRLDDPRFPSVPEQIGGRSRWSHTVLVTSVSEELGIPVDATLPTPILKIGSGSQLSSISLEVAVVQP